MNARKDEIRQAYRAVGKAGSFYDGMITCSTLLGKAVCGLVWDMNQAENARYLEWVFDAIPQDFSGRLLEVPVGTGILTMPLYKTLPKARVTCLDYSPDMMDRARRRANEMGVKNVSFQQGDVGALPFADNTFDIVLSLNGFHAFPDKDAAYRETLRVLKPGGIFCGAFYVAGEVARTDWFIRKLYMPKGYFTPPFETMDSLRKRLMGLYQEVTTRAVKAEGCFVCRKARR